MSVPVLSQGVSEVITILRNVTGRVDANDPLFSDPAMLRYLNNFIQTSNTTEVRLFQQRTWLEFNIDPTSPDPYPIDLDVLSLTNIMPPCYADGFLVFWYQDPEDFFRIWPETQTYAPSRPTYVLYYNQQLVFRNPPNKSYHIKMAAYKIDMALASGQSIPSAYLYRYLAYGTALDIFGDYGEMDKYAQTEPVYRKYKLQVLARTWDQYNNQRTGPDF